MKITIDNDIVKKIDIIREDYGDMKLKFMFQRNEERFVMGKMSIERVERLLELFGKDSLSKVKNVPVRLALDVFEKDEEAEIIAIGDLLENRWLMLATYQEKQITTFEEMIGYDRIKDIEFGIWL